MKLQQLALIILLSFGVAFATGRYVVPSAGQKEVTRESAYDRVMRTGIIRCGYADWPPYGFVKDPLTGNMSGVFADITQAIADKLHLKIEWVENTGWGSNIIEGLRTNRFDAFCEGLMRNAERGRYIAYGTPVFYNAEYPYVAIDEHRFDKDLSAINQPDVRISTMDGEMSDIIAKIHFPRAKAISVPQTGQISDILLNVTSHKADIVFTEPSFAEGYMKTNPNSLRRLQDTPYQVSQTSYAVEIHESQLRDMLDSALSELQNHGMIEEILTKYGIDPKVFLRVAKPYTQP